MMFSVLPFKRTGSIVLRRWTTMNQRTLFIATLVEQRSLVISLMYPQRSRHTSKQAYGTDFAGVRLESHLQLFAVNFRKDNHNIKKITLKDIILFFKSLTVPQRSLYSEVVTLLKIILVMPATNALSKRSFS